MDDSYDPLLASMANMSRIVLAWHEGVHRVHLSPAPFSAVCAGYGCHRDWLKPAEAGPRSCAEWLGVMGPPTAAAGLNQRTSCTTMGRRGWRSRWRLGLARPL